MLIHLVHKRCFNQDVCYASALTNVPKLGQKYNKSLFIAEIGHSLRVA